MLECVPNVSAGRELDVIDGLAASCGTPLLDVHVDADHNRSVFTLAAPEVGAVTRSVRGLAGALAARVSIAAHEGVHPRLGALDVVPFVALTGDAAVATHAAHE